MKVYNSFSLTNDYLLPKIYAFGHTPEKGLRGFAKRELLSRLLACTTFLFRTADFFVNFGKGLKSTCLYIACRVGRRSISISSKALDSALIYFREAKKAMMSNPFQQLKLMISPSGYREYPSHVTQSSIFDVLLDIDRFSIAQSRLNTMNDKFDNNWGIKDFFGQVHVINLDDKNGSTQYANRLKNTEEELKKVGVEFDQWKRFRAIHGATELSEDIWSKIDDNSFNKSGEELTKVHKAQAGNFMSHYRLIKEVHTQYTKAKAEFEELKQSYVLACESKKGELWQQLQNVSKRVKEYSSVVIIEDDNGFGFLHQSHSQEKTQVVLQGTGKYFNEAMKELPKDWHIFYFMAEHGYDCNLLPYSSRLNRLHYGVGLNAYAVNHTAYEVILKAMNKIEEPKAKVRPTDHVIASLHRNLNVFVPVCPLAYQRGDLSSISGGCGANLWNGFSSRGY